MRINKEIEDGYDILLKQIVELENEFEKLNGYRNRFPYFVFFRQKYDRDDKWIYHCCELEVENELQHDENFIWQYDFDEGQDEIELLGITPMDMMITYKPIIKVEEFTERN